MALSEYDKINLSGQQQANIQALTNQYNSVKNQAMANGGINADTQAKLDQIHNAAEHIRASGGSYLGGTEGIDYIPLEKETHGRSAPTAPTLRSATSQADYVNSLYDAQRQAALTALKTAYENNKVTLDAQAEKIPGIYQDARNTTAAQSEQNRANFNEYAAASGLNSGAGGQAQLAMTNQLLGSLSGIDRSEAEAKNDLETERTRLATNYENAIAQAIADGDLQRAQALYQEAVRVDESLVATSLNQANLDLNYWSAGNQVYQQQLAMQQNKAQTLGAYGNFSGYLDLGYSQEQIDNMYKVWAAQNPLLAAALGGGYGYGYGSGRGSGSKVSSSTSKNENSGGSGGGIGYQVTYGEPKTDLAQPWKYDSSGNVTRVSVKNAKTGAVTMMPITQVQQLVKSGWIQETKGSNGKVTYVDKR